MAEIALIGAASGWGAGFRHTEEGPPALRQLGLADWLRAAGLEAGWRAMVRAEKRWREHPRVRAPETFGLVTRHAAALADEVARAVAARRFPVVIGGDHAIAMGTWAGVARGHGSAPLGLVWLDAHLDAHTLATTPSMNAHGMGAAALLGHGYQPFVDLCGGVLQPRHLCYVGVRSYEEGEMALLQYLGVRIIHMDEVKRRGVDDCLAEALAIATTGTAGFGITIDLDGFDPADAPAIGLKEPDGLRAAPTLAALARLARHPALRGLEIVEYIPEFDEELRTAHLVRDLVLAVLAPHPVPAAAR
ncbi:MAG TPA: arginase [Stellaceae bacterium]|jgi:arginase|nr:arginase [Stellaceae bacterium]